MGPKKQIGCHHVLTQIILLATVCVGDTSGLQSHFSLSPVIPDTEAPCQKLSFSTSDDIVSPEWSTHKAQVTSTFYWKCPQSYTNPTPNHCGMPEEGTRNIF